MAAGYSQGQAKLIMTFLVAIVAIVVIGLPVYLVTTADEGFIGKPDVESTARSSSTTLAVEQSGEAIADADTTLVTSFNHVEYFTQAEQMTILIQPQGYTFETIDEFYWYPVSSEFGPSVFDQGSSAGFARTPEGAALAAIHLYYRTLPTLPSWQSIAESHLVGPGVRARIDNGIELQSSVNDVKEVFALKEAPVGWDILDYSESADSATVAVYGDDINSKSPFVRTLRVVWQDEDWRLVVPADNEFELSRSFGEPNDVSFVGSFR